MNKGLLLRLKPSAPDPLTILSALLIVVSFPPWNLYPLIWVALVPWLLVIDQAGTYWRAFREAVWLCFLMTMGGFFWVASVLQEFGGLPWSLSILGLILFGFIAQPQFYLVAPIIKLIRSKTGAHNRPLTLAFLALCLALFYSGLDWILPKLFVDTLGHSFYTARNLRQIADLTGAHGLTVLIFLTNYSLFQFIQAMRRRGEPSWWPALSACGPTFILALTLCAVSWGYGKFRNSQISAAMETPVGRLQAGVIQGNIGDFDKVAAERGIRDAAQKVIDTLTDLSDQALALSPKPDVLIWPETSYPSTFRTPESSEELARDLRIEGYVKARSVPLLFGGYDHVSNKDYNSFFFLTPPATNRPALASSPSSGKATSSDESDLQVYHKSILLLFGEYIPGAEQIRFLKDAFPQVGNFGRGEGPSVLKIHTRATALPTVLAGPIICYEALFPNYVIGAAKKGSQLILNITNDSWFGPIGEPQLHLALVTFRSIETRLPQLRSTNTGITALILPNGEIAQQTAIGRPEILNATVPILRPMPTLMKAWGDWFGIFAFIAGALGLLAIGLVVKTRDQ